MTDREPVSPQGARPRDLVGPFLHYLMSECGLSPNTLAAYRSDLMKFMRWRKTHAPGPIGSIDVQTLTGYVEELSLRGLSPRSVGRHLASLSTFFRYLIFEGKITENTVRLLDSPTVWDRLPTVLGPPAIERLLQSPDPGTPLGSRDRAALET
ncbi:MAG: tyrosine-type recombinase/integrase, partial [Isosphaeraceae bacterium]